MMLGFSSEVFLRAGETFCKSSVSINFEWIFHQNQKNEIDYPF